MPATENIDKQKNSIGTPIGSRSQNVQTSGFTLTFFAQCSQRTVTKHSSYASRDAFTKYAVVTAIANKEAETVANAIFKDWFAKLGIPAQIHTDGGKEFVNKL